MYPIPPLNPYPSYQPPGGYQPPPPGGVYNPYGGPTQPPPPPPNTVIASTPEQPEQPPKKGKFGGKFGSTVCLTLILSQLVAKYSLFSWLIQLSGVSDLVQVGICFLSLIIGDTVT